MIPGLWYVNNVSLSYILVPSVFNYRVPPWPQEKTPCFFKLEFQIHPGARVPNKKTADSVSALLSREGIESGFEEGENTNTQTDSLLFSQKRLCSISFFPQGSRAFQRCLNFKYWWFNNCLYKTLSWGDDGRNGLVVMSTACSFRGQGFKPKTHGVAYNYK